MITTFNEIKLNNPIKKALKELGFENPTEIQRQSFSPIRSGKDIIGIAQTGTGKTFAYLMPLLMKLNRALGMTPRALIVVPTRELVLQVCENIESLSTYMDIRFLGIYGGVNINTQKEKVYEGTDLLVATPGRLMDIYVTGILKLSQIKTLVIDEADKMMDLGFMPQLNAIFELLPEKRQNLLYSASFSNTVAKLSENFLSFPQRIEITPQATTVEHIRQIQYRVPNILSKLNLLQHLLQNKEQFHKVIVFAETKRNANRIAEHLKAIWADELAVIHANKAQNTRIKALNSFKDGSSRIMVASDVAARGIDIENVSHVVNFDIPSDYVEYVHRIGRTGRAEKKGTSISFVTDQEEELMKKIEALIRKKVVEQNVPDEVEITSQLLDDEKIQTRNIRLKTTVSKENRAFHRKKAKNTKQNSGSMAKRKAAKRQKRKR